MFEGSNSLKTSDITITRVTSALPAPDAEFAEATPDSDTYTMKAAVIGVEQDYVDGELVMADDLQIIAPAYATKDGVEAIFKPLTTDEFSIDGVIHRANKIEAFPASGVVAAYMIFVKS